jgi:hypothetical protein
MEMFPVSETYSFRIYSDKVHKPSSPEINALYFEIT